MDDPDQLFIDALLNEIRSIAVKGSLGKHEIPRRFIIDFEPFTAENGLRTSSLKFCRRKLASHYADRLKSHCTIKERLQRMLKITIGQRLSTDTAINFMTADGLSLGAIRISRMIQDELGVDIPLDLLFESKTTLEQLAKSIPDSSQLCFSSDALISKLNSDAKMNLNLIIGQRRPTVPSPTTIFITGTTDFVGAFLLNELLTTYSLSCKFICLVKSHPSVINAFDRIRQNMAPLHLWKEEYRDRIIGLSGDLAKTKLGVDDTTYEQLAANIYLIFHCGAIVNFVLPYTQLYDSNVSGTCEKIRLACCTPTCVPVHDTSTMSVLSVNLAGPKNLQNGYAQSKWVAEKLIAKANRAGLPVAIYRPGLILADTKTGACNRNDFYTLIIATMMTTQCYPKEITNVTITGIPANIAARNIVHLSRDKTNLYGRIHEIVNKENVLSFESICECMESCGLRMECVTCNE